METAGARSGIGALATNSWGGAALGGVIGAGTGYLITRNTYRCWKTNIFGHRYRGSVDVSHLDLYRFRGLSAAEWGDLEPYFEGAVVFVEWPEAGSGALPRPRAAVRLEHLAPERRLVTIEAEPGTSVADFTAE